MKNKTKQISTTKTTKTTTITVEYGLEHVHNLHLEIFPVLHVHCVHPMFMSVKL